MVAVVCKVTSLWLP